MIYEIRQYYVNSGEMENWLQLMENKIIPFQEKIGVKVVASFTVADNDNLYVWIRGFEDEKRRKELYKDLYENDFWLNEIKPAIDLLLDREKTVITNVIPTPKSPLK